jgi:choline dehydrogenase-like flavoprotein
LNLLLLFNYDFVAVKLKRTIKRQAGSDNVTKKTASAEAGGNKTTTDVIVIGSGFGGAVAADRLVWAGLKVRLFERGPWRSTAPVLARRPGDTVPLPAQNRPGLIVRDIRPSGGPREIRLNKRGLLEFHLGKGVKTLASSGVGGGSHIWSALVARPDDPDYWNGRAEGLSEAVMASHYERVWQELGAVRPSNTASIPNLPPTHGTAVAGSSASTKRSSTLSPFYFQRKTAAGRRQTGS